VGGGGGALSQILTKKNIRTKTQEKEPQLKREEKKKCWTAKTAEESHAQKAMEKN